MVQIVETTAFYKNLIAMFENADAAIKYLKEYHGAECLEEDKDHPGFYDCFTKHGRVYSIEPIK